MFQRIAACVVCSVMAIAVVGHMAGAAAKDPSAVEVLFDRPHLATIGAGTEVKYRFERKTSDVKKLGESFDDNIKLGVLKVDKDSGKRTVTLQMFSGERARKQQRITGMTGNPVLVVFLDRAVSNFKSVAGGSRPYLKDRFRNSLRDKAKIEAAKVDYKGEKVDGYRVTLQPYLDDKNKLKMLGYEGAEFVFLVSDKVPGHFISLESKYVSSIEGSPTMSERIVFDGEGEAKPLQ